MGTHMERKPHQKSKDELIAECHRLLNELQILNIEAGRCSVPDVIQASQFPAWVAPTISYVETAATEENMIYVDSELLEFLFIMSAGGVYVSFAVVIMQLLEIRTMRRTMKRRREL